MYTRLFQRRFGIILAILLCLLLVGGGVWANRLFGDLQALERNIEDVTTLLQTRNPTRWPELCAAAAQSSVSLRRLEARLGPLPTLLAPLHQRADAAAAVLRSATALDTTATQGCALLHELAAPFVPEQDVPSQLTQRLAAARPQLLALDESLQRAAVALDAVPQHGLRDVEAAQLAQARTVLSSLQETIQLAVYLPALLGADTPRSYLVVVQNPDELRPTGGFLSAAGVVRIEQGRISEFRTDDTTLIDNLRGAAYPLAPEPIRRYMLRQSYAPALWVFRDANWSPDFPTAAADMLTLYELGRNERPEGVLAITPAAVARLLSAVGPLRIEGLSRPVDSTTINNELRSAYDDAIQQGRAEDRKSFVNRLAEALLNRLSNADQATFIAVGRAIYDSFETSDLQLSLPADPISPWLAAQGWDGAINPGTADFLMTASANIGYNKVGPQISQQMTYQVDLRNPLMPQANLTVTERNQSPGAAICVPLEARDPGYAPLTQGCYWNYLRVFAPGSVVLTDALVARVPDTWMLSGNGDDGRLYRQPGPGGSRVFGALTVTPPAGSSQLRLRYLLPLEVLSESGGTYRYQLHIQRQPGLQQTARIEISIPDEAQLIGAEPAPQSRSGQTFFFTLDLSRDYTIMVQYR